MKFTITGSLAKQDTTTGKIISSGSSFIIDPINHTLISTINHANTDFTIFSGETDHTSKSEYLVVGSNYGYTGEARLFQLEPPTIEVVNQTFQEQLSDLYAVSNLVTVISGETFESGSLGSLQITISGTGAVNYSGLVNQTLMGGNYFVGLNMNGSDGRIQYIEPTTPQASGILCGRTIFLSRLPINTNFANSSQVGFCFLRQGLDIKTDNCYKVVIGHDPGSDKNLRLDLFRGPINSAFNNNTINNGTYRIASIVEHSSIAAASGTRLKWYMVEWEVNQNQSIAKTDKAVLFRISYRNYEVGDTLESVKTQMIPLIEQYDIRSDALTTTSYAPAWAMAVSSNGDNFAVGIDNILLESFDSLPKTSLNQDLVLISGTGANISNPEALSRVEFLSDDPTPEGLPDFTSTRNYLIPSGSSIVSIAGKAPSYVFRSNGNSTFQGHAFEYINPQSSGILFGAFRFAAFNDNSSGFNDTGCAFTFLKQGSALLGVNGYSVWVFSNNNATDGTTIQLRKGAFISAIDPLSLGGTTLASVTVSGTSFSHAKNWIEVQWKVVSPTQTDIEVFRKPLDTSLATFDVSPGNVDYGLTNLISYSDLSSPYTNTSASCQVTFTGRSSSKVWFFKHELRRSKVT